MDMARALIDKGRIALCAAALLSGCSGPIETRIMSAGVAAPLSAEQSFRFAAAPDPLSEVQIAAQNLVTERLGSHGLRPGEPAQLVVTVAVADRPAAIGIVRADPENGAQTLASPKPRKPLQNCDDREHRVQLTIESAASGALHYRGAAAEYHCRARLSETLPLLVDAALADLGAPKGEWRQTRTGLE
jgi:hypothetical protein